MSPGRQRRDPVAVALWILLGFALINLAVWSVAIVAALTYQTK